MFGFLAKTAYILVLSSLILTYSNLLNAQADNEGKKADYEIKEAANEGKIADKLQFFNRANWRIQNINTLVNKWKSADDYKILSMELESLSKLISASEGQLSPESGKDEFLENTSDIKSICSEMIDLSNNKKHDELKLKTNELFAKYTKLKLSLKDKTLRDFQ